MFNRDLKQFLVAGLAMVCMVCATDWLVYPPTISVSADWSRSAQTPDGSIDTVVIGRDTLDWEIYDDSASAFLGYYSAEGWGAGAMKMARDSAVAGAWPYYIWAIDSRDNDASPGTYGACLDSARVYPNAFKVCVITESGTSYSHSGTYSLNFDSVQYLMVVGQTARGRGFTSRRSGSYTTDAAKLKSINNVVLRYHSWHMDSGNCIQWYGADYVIFDHMSGSHCGSGSGGGIFNIVGGDTIEPGKTTHISFLNSTWIWGTPRMASNGALGAPSMPWSNPVGGDGNLTRLISHKGSYGVTHKGNTFIGPSRRAPNAKGGLMSINDHIIYNLNNPQGTGVSTGTGHGDWIGVWEKHGPGGNAALRGNYLKMRNFSCYDSISPPDTAGCPRSMYAADYMTDVNGWVSESDPTALYKGDVGGGDSLIYCIAAEGDGEDDSDTGACQGGDRALIPDEWIRSVPLDQSDNPFGWWTVVQFDSARRAEQLARGGDSEGLTCDGKMSATIDGYTRRHQWVQDRYDEIATGSGESSDVDPSDPGFEPDSAHRITGGEVQCADANSDFLPDDFVKALTGDPDDSTSIAPDSAMGRYGHTAGELYWWAYFSDVITVKATISNSPDSIVFRVDGVRVGGVNNPLNGSRWYWLPDSYETWAIGDDVEIQIFQGPVLVNTDEQQIEGDVSPGGWYGGGGNGGGGGGGQMVAPTANVLAAEKRPENTDSTEFNTPSISPEGDSLLIAWMHTRIDDTGDSADIPTVTGNGLSWVEVDTMFGHSATYLHGVSIFCARGGSPTPGAVNFDFGSQVISHALFGVVQINNADTAGACTDAIVQTVLDESQNDPNEILTITMAAFDTLYNRALALLWSIENPEIILTPGTNYTPALDEDTIYDGWMSQSLVFGDTVDVTIDFEQVGATNPDLGGIAMEIAALPGCSALEFDVKIPPVAGAAMYYIWFKNMSDGVPAWARQDSIAAVPADTTLYEQASLWEGGWLDVGDSLYITARNGTESGASNVVVTTCL